MITKSDIVTLSVAFLPIAATFIAWAIHSVAEIKDLRRENNRLRERIAELERQK